MLSDVYDTQMDETNFLVDTASKNKVYQYSFKCLTLLLR